MKCKHLPNEEKGVDGKCGVTHGLEHEISFSQGPQ